MRFKNFKERKSNSNYLWLVIFFLLLMCYYFSYLNGKNRNLSHNMLINYNNHIRANMSEINWFENNLFTLISKENTVIDTTMLLLDKNASILSLNSVLDNENTLILYASGIPCHTCIHKLLQLINNVVDKAIGLNTICLISKDSNLECGVFQRLSGIRTYKTDLFIDGLESKNLYFFIVDNKSKIHFFYKASNKDYEKDKKYLNNVISAFSN